MLTLKMYRLWIFLMATLLLRFTEETIFIGTNHGVVRYHVR